MPDTRDLLGGGSTEDYGLSIFGGGNPWSALAAGGEWGPTSMMDRLFGGGGGPSMQASAMRAAIARDLWEDYKTRFVPLEDRLIGTIGNKALQAEQIEKSQELVGQGFDVADTGYRDTMRGYGLTLTPAQEQAYARRSNVSETASKVGAANLTRRAIQDRDLAAMGLNIGGARELAGGSA